MNKTTALVAPFFAILGEKWVGCGGKNTAFNRLFALRPQ
jgi:hypothetical protein